MPWNSAPARSYLSGMTNDFAVDRITPSTYTDSYRALLNLASLVQDDARHDGLFGLACAAYGWMPTILKNFSPENFCTNTPNCGVISKIRGIRKITDAREFLSCMEEVAPINRSWVGTSKLLHFLNPSFFPIWDSRVAVRFSLKSPTQINKKEAYLKYFEFVHEEISRGHTWLDTVSERIERDNGYRPSQVRCLELMLFLRS